jgi:hypothetical protein
MGRLPAGLPPVGRRPFHIFSSLLRARHAKMGLKNRYLKALWPSSPSPVLAAYRSPTFPVPRGRQGAPGPGSGEIYVAATKRAR